MMWTQVLVDYRVCKLGLSAGERTYTVCGATDYLSPEQVSEASPALLPIQINCLCVDGTCVRRYRRWVTATRWTCGAWACCSTRSLSGRIHSRPTAKWCVPYTYIHTFMHIQIYIHTYLHSFITAFIYAVVLLVVVVVVDG